MNELPHLVAKIKQDIFLIGDSLSRAKKLFDEGKNFEETDLLDAYADKINKAHDRLQVNMLQVASISSTAKKRNLSLQDIAFVISKLTGIPEEMCIDVLTLKKKECFS